MKILQMMVIGLLFSLSASYTTVTMVAVFNSDIVFSGAELLEQLIIAAILGPVIGLGSLLFELDRVPFFIQLFLHFLYVTTCVLTAGWFGEWYINEGVLSIEKVLMIEVLIYILVWLTLYIIQRKDITEINQKIKKSQEVRR